MIQRPVNILIFMSNVQIRIEIPGIDLLSWGLSAIKPGLYTIYYADKKEKAQGKKQLNEHMLNT